MSEPGTAGFTLRADGTVVAWGRNSEGQCTLPEGMKNGAVNGLAEGMKNGAVNGMAGGLKNGTVNGLTAGLKNGTVNGLKNGTLKNA